MEDKLEFYKMLVKDIIETLDGRDDSVKEWIEESLKEIEEDEEIDYWFDRQSGDV